MNWRSLSRRNADLIRSNLAWLMAAMLSTGLILLFTRGVLHDYRSQLQALQARLNDTRAAAEATQTAWRDTSTNQQRYLELQQRGVVGGGEHRLEWVERLSAIQRAEPALQLHYRIEPQRQLEHSKPAGGSALVSSRMKVGYAALHEEDFSRLHHHLSKAPGWLAASRCVIDRPPESAARLAIECDYEWLSIAPNAVAKEGMAR